MNHCVSHKAWVCAHTGIKVTAQDFPTLPPSHTGVPLPTKFSLSFSWLYCLPRTLSLEKAQDVQYTGPPSQHGWRLSWCHSTQLSPTGYFSILFVKRISWPYACNCLLHLIPEMQPSWGRRHNRCSPLFRNVHRKCAQEQTEGHKVNEMNQQQGHFPEVRGTHRWLQTMGAFITLIVNIQKYQVSRWIVYGGWKWDQNSFKL